MRAVLAVEPVPIEQQCDVHPDVAKWVNQALRKEPFARPGIDAGLAALEAALPADGHDEVRACMDRAWPLEEERRRTDLMPAMQPKPPVTTVKAQPENRKRSLFAPLGLGAALGIAIAVGVLVARDGGGSAMHAGAVKPAPPLPPRVPEPEPVAATPPPTVTPPSPPTPTPVPKPQKKRGKLLVLSFHHVRFWVDGEPKGETPMAAPLEVPAGPHDVRAVNEHLGFDKHYRITVEPSQTATVKVVVPQPAQ